MEAREAECHLVPLYSREGRHLYSRYLKNLYNSHQNCLDGWMPSQERFLGWIVPLYFVLIMVLRKKIIQVFFQMIWLQCCYWSWNISQFYILFLSCTWTRFHASEVFDLRAITVTTHAHYSTILLYCCTFLQACSLFIKTLHLLYNVVTWKKCPHEERCQIHSFLTLPEWALKGRGLYTST